MALREARDKLKPRGAWTTDSFARTRDGNPIGPKSANAVCFCAYGAIKAVAPSLLVEREAAKLLAMAIEGDQIVEVHRDHADALGTIFEYNDCLKSKQPILRRFDKAVALAEELAS